MTNLGDNRPHFLRAPHLNVECFVKFERFRLLGPDGLTLAKCSLELAQQFLLLGGILFKELLLRYPQRQERIFRTD